MNHQYNGPKNAELVIFFVIGCYDLCVCEREGKSKGVGCQVLIGLVHMIAFVVDFTD